MRFANLDRTADVVGQRVAILAGNANVCRESGLRPLRGPLNDVAAMHRVLADPELGQYKTLLLNDQTSQDLRVEIARALTDLGPSDSFVFYFSGHGTLDLQGQLCLVTQDTDERILYATSLPVDQIRELVRRSRCASITLILDCCYSGKAALARGGVLPALAQATREAKGIFVLAGSAPLELAEESDVDGGIHMGRFTRALVEGIEAGTADLDGDGLIGLSDLRAFTTAALGGQTPWLMTSGDGEPVIARGRLGATARVGQAIPTKLDRDLERSLLVAADMLGTVVYKQLRRICQGKIITYNLTDSFKNELRILRDRGLIAVVGHVGEIPRDGSDVRLYVQPTALGLEVVKVKESAR